MITRAPRPTSNFYLLNKAISEDKRIGWAARGMLVFLLGKPDRWTVSPAALVNETAGAFRSTGRDGVYAVLNELKDAGYLHTLGNRNDGGTFAGADYLVSETPHTEKPDAVNPPHTDYPDAASGGSPCRALPYPANPTVVSIEGKQGLREESKEGKEAQAPAPELASTCPSDVDPQTWADWLQLRKTKRAVVTHTVTKGARAEADKAGMSFEAFLAVWCTRGSQGLEASWLTNGQGQGIAAGQSAETFKERDTRIAQDRADDVMGRARRSSQSSQAYANKGAIPYVVDVTPNQPRRIGD